MRQVTRKGLITVAAAGGVLALGGGYAHADSGASGTAVNSPGVLSGNNVQVPVHVPVNVCGNTVDVVGVLNPAFGNNCANVSGKPSGGGHGGSHGGGHDGGYGGGSHPGATHTVPAGGSHAGGGAANSPGVGSGNSVEVPIDIPVNVCGNTVDVIGLLNPAMGNGCVNDAPVHPPAKPGKPGEPAVPHQPGTPPSERAIPPAPGEPSAPNTPETQTVAQPEGTDVLAQTGAGALGIAIPAGAGLLLAGTILYRRSRSRSAA
ncbi:chaplin [Streptomyces scopuliridis]|uniref:chaplin n=1 Tax=Streptomyces scopuliridis TaxID=452529 RepID=UPI002DDA04E2|nr:chaplin family protein [Streptomyces scopuliridis]